MLKSKKRRRIGRSHYGAMVGRVRLKKPDNSLRAAEEAQAATAGYHERRRRFYASAAARNAARQLERQRAITNRLVREG